MGLGFYANIAFPKHFAYREKKKVQIPLLYNCFFLKNELRRIIRQQEEYDSNPQCTFLRKFI